MNVGRLLRYVPSPFRSVLRRITTGTLRSRLRRAIGADYSRIPDMIQVVSDGRRFHIGPDDCYWLMYLGLDYEADATSVVRGLVKRGDVVVDIGANFGWYTTLFGHAVGPGGRVFGFEPVPSTYGRLEENLALNGLNGSVTAERAAVGRSSGTATLYVFPHRSHGCASLSPLGSDDYVTIETPVVRVEDFLRCRGVETIQFLKCDVEGAELEALASCGDFLLRPNAPAILVELNEETTKYFRTARADIWQFLANAGYDQFYEIVSSRSVRRVHQISDLRDAILLCGKGDQFTERLVLSGVRLVDRSSRTKPSFVGQENGTYGSH